MSAASDDYARLALSAIIVPAARQRSDLALDDDFLNSIRLRGVLSPLLVKRDGTLVAGGRRYAASTVLGLPDAPVRYVADNLTPTELRVIELEENIQRAALPWRDEVRAVAELHQLWTTTRGSWSQQRSEEQIGCDISRYLRVARELSNPRLDAATSIMSAYNICQRIDARHADMMMEDIIFAADSRAQTGDAQAHDVKGSAPVAGSNAGAESGGEPATAETPGSPSTTRRQSTAPSAPTDDVLQTDFIAWASTYSGPRFNFIHCDFPYGKRIFSGEWGGKNDAGFQYKDEPDTYWELLTALCKNLDRLMTSSAHLMFWLSSEVEMQSATIAKFRELAPELIFQPRALVWLKSDNVGIVPDPKRGPRWITELALMASRGDRMLVKPLGNAYAAPTARALHPSAKPEPVLRHFFGMFIDSTSRVLDPTCGGGSSLRAAESLGAASVLGIEREEQYANAARKTLREFRALRELSR
jgi:ParB/RepB/Spo0J family partition protein